MGADGAIRSDVIAVLTTRGVDVEEVGEGRVRLAKGTQIEVMRLQPVVSRHTLSRFERLFGTPIASFYPAISRVPEKKASGS